MIEISGSSGCALKILNNNVIRKTAKKENYILRLKKQKNKQDFFYKNFSTLNITTPKILKVTKNSFSMEYFNYYKNFTDFFNECDLNKINLFCQNICSVILRFIEKSKIEEVDFNIISKKYFSIEKGEYAEELNSYFNRLKFKKIKIPIGFCHGDLTFSNMLFFNEKIVLLDFLDTFIETPLQDIVKLRQDTCYFWSFLKTNKVFDENKIEIVFKYIDKKLCDAFSNLDYYKNYYKLFQFINLTRIIPYTDNKIELNLLINSIRYLINEQ